MSNSKNISTNSFRDITRNFLHGEVHEDEENGESDLTAGRRSKNSTVIKEAGLSAGLDLRGLHRVLDDILVAVEKVEKKVRAIERELGIKSAGGRS